MTAPLTPRQTDVLRELLHGKHDKEIAKELGLSYGVVKLHLKDISLRLGMEKLSRLSLALYAIEHRLLKEEDDD